MKWNDLFNQELRDPVNAAGTAAAITGGLGMMGILFDFPDWIFIFSFILWVIGIGLLAYHSRIEQPNKQQTGDSDRSRPRPR